MSTPGLYEIETSAGDDDTMHPAEQVWTPCADGETDHGFIAHQGLFIAGIDGGSDDDLYPVGFLVLGHQRWADIIEAATAYMARTHGWCNLHLYPGDDPSVLIPRIPRAVHTHGVFLRHQHAEYACGCEWDAAWRMVWVPASGPGAVPITALRHPAATVESADIPNPDEGAPATWAT
ncbi:hypothetical protein AB0L54_35040 [Streptomyces sp. NPDC052196]|uniref:hypothetical protein n=1 Tax=Streptomyces sp. NPDC052196 TaxID=3156691 RepID=UPI0034154965